MRGQGGIGVSYQALRYYNLIRLKQHCPVFKLCVLSEKSWLLKLKEVSYI